MTDAGQTTNASSATPADTLPPGTPVESPEQPIQFSEGKMDMPKLVAAFQKLDLQTAAMRGHNAACIDQLAALVDNEKTAQALRQHADMHDMHLLNHQRDIHNVCRNLGFKYKLAQGAEAFDDSGDPTEPVSLPELVQLLSEKGFRHLRYYNEVGSHAAEDLDRDDVLANAKIFTQTNVDALLTKLQGSGMPQPAIASTNKGKGKAGTNKDHQPFPHPVVAEVDPHSRYGKRLSKGKKALTKAKWMIYAGAKDKQTSPKATLLLYSNHILPSDCKVTTPGADGNARRCSSDPHRDGWVAGCIIYLDSTFKYCPFCENGLANLKPTDWTQPQGSILVQMHPDFGVDSLGVVRYMGMRMPPKSKNGIGFVQNDYAMVGIDKVPEQQFYGRSFTKILKDRPEGTFILDFKCNELPSVAGKNTACAEKKDKKRKRLGKDDGEPEPKNPVTKPRQKKPTPRKGKEQDGDSIAPATAIQQFASTPQFSSAPYAAQDPEVYFDLSDPRSRDNDSDP